MCSWSTRFDTINFPLASKWSEKWRSLTGFKEYKGGLSFGLKTSWIRLNGCAEQSFVTVRNFAQYIPKLDTFVIKHKV